MYRVSPAPSRVWRRLRRENRRCATRWPVPDPCGGCRPGFVASPDPVAIIPAIARRTLRNRSVSHWMNASGLRMPGFAVSRACTQFHRKGWQGLFRGRDGTGHFRFGCRRQRRWCVLLRRRAARDGPEPSLRQSQAHSGARPACLWPACGARRKKPSGRFRIVGLASWSCPGGLWCG